MIGLIARRLGRVVAVVFAVAVVAQLLAEAAPGTPAERAARAAGILPADDSAIGADARRELLDAVADQHELGGSAPARLVRYVAGLATGDLGTSWRDGASVRGRVAGAAGPTLVLVVASLVLGLALGVGGAIAAASRPGGRADVALGAATAAAIAMPPVWLAMLALRGFGGGGYALGVAVMTVVPAFVASRYARAALVELAATPWATAARARGLPAARVIAVHALKAGAAQLLPLVSILTAYLLGSSMVVERVFGIRGLGAVLVDASASGDAPVIAGVCVAAGGAIALASGIADVAAYALDPRERREADGGA